VEILVVNDHILIREALCEKCDASVLEAPSCSQAMQVIAEHPGLTAISQSPLHYVGADARRM
jgi:hypothetical protein